MYRLGKTLWALILLPVLATPTAQSESIALIGGRIIDGTGRAAIENGVVVVSGGKIQAVGRKEAVKIPKDARLIDVTGKTLMPALVDLHTHLGQTINGADSSPEAYTEQNIDAQLSHLLAYGIGTVGVMGTDRDLIYDLRQEQQEGKLPGAHFYTAGRGFGAKGGLPGGGGTAGDVYRPENAEQARAEVRELAAHHPSFVKMWVDDGYGRVPKMSPEVYRAIIDEAHRHNLRVFAHVYYLADAKSLLAAGVDGLAHSVRDQAVDAELIAALKARYVIYIPTLVRDESTFVYADPPKWLNDPFFQSGLLPGVIEKLESPAFRQHAAADRDQARNRASLAMGEKNLLNLYRAGVRVGFGTDAGMPGRYLGYFEHRELQLMVESGLTPLQAIVCATRNAARFLSDDFGTLEPGQRADIVVLKANPLENVMNTERIDSIWQAGTPVSPVSAN